MPKLTISLAQMNVIAGDISRNNNQFQKMVAEASRRKSSLLVFPELFSTGYVLDEAKDHADDLSKGMFAEISNMATKGNLAITGSVMEKRGLEVANSMPFFAPNGIPRGPFFFPRPNPCPCPLLRILLPGQGFFAFAMVCSLFNIRLNPPLKMNAQGTPEHSGSPGDPADQFLPLVDICAATPRCKLLVIFPLLYLHVFYFHG